MDATPQPSSTEVRAADAYAVYDAAQTSWRVGSALFERRVTWSPEEGLRLAGLSNRITNRSWALPPSPGQGPSGHPATDVGMTIDGVAVASLAGWHLAGWSLAAEGDRGVRLHLSFDHPAGTCRLHLHTVTFAGSPAWRGWPVVENTGSAALLVEEIASIALPLAAPGGVAPTLHRLSGIQYQGGVRDGETLSGPYQTFTLAAAPLTVPLVIASGRRSSWENVGSVILRDGVTDDCLFCGVEWSGRWVVRFDPTAPSDGGAGGAAAAVLRGGMSGTRHRLAPGASLAAPAVFCGLAAGDVQDATVALHGFARRHLAPPRPAEMPWTAMNTWYSYGVELDEATQCREVASAAGLGLELYYLDAGWYHASSAPGWTFSPGLGDWQENRAKFPSGLAAFSAATRAAGLRFGLWVEPERVDLATVRAGVAGWDEEFLARGDDGAPIEADWAPGSAQVCFGNPAARAWAGAWLARLVDDFAVSWLKWDSNMWGVCRAADHGHGVDDGEYHQITGLYEVLAGLRAAFPDLVIENCAGGGCRLDYGIYAHTHAAWASDETAPAARVRHHAAGLAQAFPPEYLTSWVIPSPEEPLPDNTGGHHGEPAGLPRGGGAVSLATQFRSRMIGGFGLSLVTRDWPAELRERVRHEVALARRLRPLLRARYYRLLPQPGLQRPRLDPPAAWEAYQFVSDDGTEAAVLVFRGAGPSTQPAVALPLRGLDPLRTYEVRWEGDTGAEQERVPGAALLDGGLRCHLEEPLTCAVAILEAVRGAGEAW